MRSVAVTVFILATANCVRGEHFVTAIVFAVSDAIYENPSSKTERPQPDEDQRNDVADGTVVGATLIVLDGDLLVFVRRGGLAESEAKYCKQELHHCPAEVDESVCVGAEEDEVENDVGRDGDAKTDTPDGSEAIDDDIASRVVINNHDFLNFFFFK